METSTDVKDIKRLNIVQRAWAALLCWLSYVSVDMFESHMLVVTPCHGGIFISGSALSGMTGVTVAERSPSGHRFRVDGGAVPPHSLNYVREEDTPEIIGLQSLRDACAALQQVECTSLLNAYLVEAATIESLRAADRATMSVAVIVVAAWNAYKRLHGQEPANDAGEAPKG